MIDGSLSSSPERGAVGADHPMLAGHFPGHPIVPGAWLLAWIVALANRRLTEEGQARTVAGIKRVKFLRPIAPEQAFECVFRQSIENVGNGTLRFTLRSDDAVVAEGSLQLHQRSA